MVYYYHHAHHTHPPTFAMDFPSYDKRASQPFKLWAVERHAAAAVDHATAAALTTTHYHHSLLLGADGGSVILHLFSCN